MRLARIAAGEAKFRDSRKGTSDAGGVIGIVLVLVVLKWISEGPDLALREHNPITISTDFHRFCTSIGHRGALHQIAEGWTFDLHQAETILVPRPARTTVSW